ncbi:hypothetical protein KKG90_04455 [Candidatus Bipolaricaulota bacterium]|nr:hypothetical protein [Candidatus Bipolaricaulota bacterium]
MSQRPVRTVFGVVCAIVLYGLSAAAGGVLLGVPLFTLDLSTTLTQLPVVVQGAFDALEAAAIDLGVPPDEMANIHAQFADTLAGIEQFAADFPAWVPIPLLGGGIEIGLPLLVIDGIRFSGGWLSENLVRWVSGMAGFDIPKPLMDVDIAIGQYPGKFVTDLEFHAWLLSTEVVKRLDLFLLAWNLGVGIDLLGIDIHPSVSYDLPDEMMAAAAEAVSELHVDGLSWSGFTVHGMIGFELGPPFLRLYGDLRWTVPLSQTTDWWEIRLGPVSALLGFVIRF